jgi:N-alpha-acetyltransferase 40
LLIETCIIGLAFSRRSSLARFLVYKRKFAIQGIESQIHLEEQSQIILKKMSKKSVIEEINSLELSDYIGRLLKDTPLNYTTDSTNEFIITIESAATLSKEDLEQCFNLVFTTSKSDYENSSMGWHPKAKKKEMKLPDLRYLIVRADSKSLILGFASFMLTYEDGKEVVYLYEIHLDENIRGSGLGKHLLDIVQQTGQNAGLEKIMLTVFVHNIKANAWYHRLGFKVDEYSPGPRKLRNGVVKEPDYQILSKPLLSSLSSKD